MKKIVFLFCLCSFYLGAQDYRFNNYNINDGLSQSSVNSILQDDNGGLWIGTQDGLNRFDGKSFEIFNSDETEGIESPFINASVKTEDGKCWFGSRNGLTMYDPNTEKFQTYTLDKNKILDIQDIAVSRNGQLCVATLGYGLVSFNTRERSFKIHDWSGGPKKVMRAVYTKNDKYLVYTEDHKLYLYDARYERGKQIQVDRFEDVELRILRMRKFSSGKIFLGTNHGVYEWNGSKGLIERQFIEHQELEHLSIKDLHYSNDNWFFATAASGLYTLNDNGEISRSTQDMFQKSALMYDKLAILYQDKKGNIWVGSDRGISSFDPDYSGIMGVGPGSNLKKSLPSPNVWSFCEDLSQRYVFIGTDLGISRLDREEGVFVHLNRWKEDLTSDLEHQYSVMSTYCLGKDTLLVGFEDGLFKLIIEPDLTYSYERLNYVNRSMMSEFDRVYTIRQEGKNTFFLTTKGGVILFNIRTGENQVFVHDRNNPTHTISNGFCRVSYRDSRGNLWFATTEGLNVLTKKKGRYQIAPHPINSKILRASKNQITTICDDGSGNLYIGTFGSGVLYVDFKKNLVRVIDRSDGLPNNVVYGLIKDGDNLWMSTNRGIASYHLKSKKIRAFKEVNGLLSNEFNTGAYFRSGSGELYFGSIYGYNFFIPDNLKEANNDLEVIITKFKLIGDWLGPGDKNSPLTKVISQTRDILLPYDQRTFTVHFQTDDLSHPELINYKYVLEGSESGEQLIGNQNEITFNSLSPGDYTLKIYARIGNGPWSTNPTTLNISIEPPYWGTWWFWTIVAFVISVIAYIMFKRTIESERREQVKLEIKVTERTKEIREQNKQIEEQNQLIEEEKNKVVEQQKLLQVEKDNAERWLANALPLEVIKELKVKGKVKTQSFKVVSVMFTDVVGFSEISRKINPERLVHRLDILFRRFDEIIKANDLEKIKTIGDAYMCAGGIPIESSTNPMDACIAALQIQDYMSKLKFDAIANHKDYWEIRLGINTGSVTAGIIGNLKLAYDVWGATVNDAEQMEKLGEPGTVSISGNTFDHIEPYFECEHIGEVVTKGNKKIDTYVVKRIKKELSVKGEGIVPNKKFYEIVQLHHFSSIKYYKTEHFVLDYLKKGLSKKLLYHSVDHSIDVVRAVEKIALREGVTDEGLFLLKTAAILHDAGFVDQYENNEEIGAQMAADWLPKYGYTEQHIKTIVELIHVTAIPHRPINKLQEIICDADLDYLGRDDFDEISNKLRKELRSMKKIDSDREWDEIQVKFLRSHKYFTKTSIESRKEKKMANLQVILDRLKEDKYKD